MDITAVIDSLHPLEIRVLAAFSERRDRAVETEQLATVAGLEASQISMAVEWLLAKSLLAVENETVTPIVSLTKTGEQYFEKQSPIELVLSVAREAAGTGKRLTIQDLQTREGLEPSDVSGAIGALKKKVPS